MIRSHISVVQWSLWCLILRSSEVGWKEVKVNVNGSMADDDTRSNSRVLYFITSACTRERQPVNRALARQLGEQRRAGKLLRAVWTLFPESRASQGLFQLDMTFSNHKFTRQPGNNLPAAALNDQTAFNSLSLPVSSSVSPPTVMHVCSASPLRIYIL